MTNILLLILTLNFIMLTVQTSLAETNFQVFFQDQSKYKDVVVAAVNSTDTIELASGEKIRLIGLRTSDNLKRHKQAAIRYDDKGNAIEEEEDAEDIAVTPIEEEALKFTAGLLVGKHVRLEFDDQKKTDDFATFAYVYLLPENLFVNAEILKKGYAHLQIIPPNMKLADQLRAAYREARTERRGLQNE